MTYTNELHITLSDLAHIQGQLEGFVHMMAINPSAYPSAEHLAKLANRIYEVRVRAGVAHEEQPRIMVTGLSDNE